MSRFADIDFFHWATFAMALLSMTLGVGIVAYLFWEGGPFIWNHGAQFLMGLDWFPDEEYGAAPMIFGSAAVTFLALIFSTPLALASAIYTSEFLDPRRRLTVKGIMEILAGVPGIVYGLLGVSLLSVWVRDVFNLVDGYTLLSASFLLAIMILPTIMTLSEDAIHSTPAEYRQAASGLGLSKMEILFSVALPHATPGIAGAILLAIGRAMGETIAVMLVIGGLDRVPEPWFDVFASGQSIASKLGREAAETLGFGEHWSALMALALILFFLVMFLTSFGNWLIKGFRK
jgi:phosphate transport system permease protein